MKINGLDLVNRPEIVLDIILNEYDGVDKVDVEQDNYDDNIVHINEDKYLILTYEEEEDIINDFNKSLFEEFLRDNVTDEAVEYIDDYAWHKDNDTDDLEKCVGYGIELVYEKDRNSIFRIL